MLTVAGGHVGWISTEKNGMLDCQKSNIILLVLFQNQTQVGTALQVFYNLGLLVNTVNEVVSKVKERLASCVQEALDPNTLSQAAHSSAGGPGRAAMPAPGNTAAWRATLWTRMEQLMDSIFSACGQVNMYMFIRIVLCSCITCILFFW